MTATSMAMPKEAQCDGTSRDKEAEFSSAPAVRGERRHGQAAGHQDVVAHPLAAAIELVASGGDEADDGECREGPEVCRLAGGVTVGIEQCDDRGQADRDVTEARTERGKCRSSAVDGSRKMIACGPEDQAHRRPRRRRRAECWPGSWK